jgi:predicted ATP-grasp superfamily ATP-dependent carboligase
MSFAALADAGRPVASLSACRARQYPMDFGRESTFVFTIDDPAVEASALRLLQQLRYSGLVEVEFKRDARDGGLKLLDINPRVWGWHSLGPRAGVDFVHLYWRQLHGEELAPARARAGVRWMRASTDLPTCALELAARRMAPRDYLRSLRRPLERAMFSLDDPLPGLLDMPLLLASMLRRRLRSLRRRGTGA